MYKRERGKILPRSNSFRSTRSSLRCRLLAVSQNLLVLGGKLAIAAGFDFALSGKLRHLAQPFDGAPHFRTKRRIRLSGRAATVSGARSIGPRHAVTGRRRHHRVNREDPRTRRKVLCGSLSEVHVAGACRRRRVRRCWLRVGIRWRTIAVPIVILWPPVGRRSIVRIRPIVGGPPVVVIPAVVVVGGIRWIVAYVVFRRTVGRVGIVRIRVIRAVAVVAIRISPAISPIRPAPAKSPAPTPSSSAPTAAPTSAPPAKPPATIKSPANIKAPAAIEDAPES